MNRFHRSSLALVLAAALTACGGTAAANPSADASAADATLTAVDMAFGSATLAAPADEAFTLAFVNEDGMPHNLAIYTDASKSTKLFEGDLVTDGTIVYEIPALTAGEYFFECSLHPGMTGRLVVGG
ncbi:MAG: cupredoxin domain-containing protein [Candidatus Limnocylindria bacterium]